MAVNPGEHLGLDPEEVRKMHDEAVAFLREQLAVGAGDLVVGCLEDGVPEAFVDCPYDGEEGAEDVEPVHVTGIEPDGSPFEPTYEQPAPVPDPDSASRPVRPSTPRPQPRSRGGRPLKTRNWRDRAARDSGSHRKPFPYGSKED
ncbi:MAG TPA: hypothetical protein VFX84_01795 [Candidatus Saccharimonadales bacterium]|nr:hypothetical protein [Candidatus Saccharimonadales bacterium]